MNSSLYKLSLLIHNQIFPVNHFVGFEALSHNFTFKLNLLAEEPYYQATEWMNQNASLQIINLDQKRYFNGFVSKVNYSPFPNKNGLFELKLRLVSWLELFECTRDYHAFENKNILEILEILFEPYPFCLYSSSQLQRQYERIPTCVQYQESHTQFLKRLLAEAQLHYYFEHSENSHRLILIDSINPNHCLNLEAVQAWQWQKQNSLLDKNTRYYAKSTALNLSPTLNFEYNDERFTLLSLCHSADDLSHHTQSRSLKEDSAQSYCNQFQATKSTNLPPLKKRYKPSIAGVQTAFLAKDARALNYHWNAGESTHEVAITHALADSNKQTQLPPDPGDELLISYQEGDADYPLVLAACYNGDSAPLFNPQQEAWASGFKGPKGNELKFNDEVDAEKISVVAGHDLTETAEHRLKISIQGAYHSQIKENSYIQVASYKISAQAIEFKAAGSLLAISPDCITLQGCNIKIN